CRLPERHHRNELSSLPPSSGNAGTRLNRPSARLTKVSQLKRSETSGLAWVASATPKASAATTKLVNGPTPAISASERALVGSPSSLDTPPKSHSVMPSTFTPWLRATSAWENSCANKQT